MIRRFFLQIFGSHLSLPVLVPGKAFATPFSPPAGTSPIAALFYDERFVPARAVAADLRRSGVLTISTTGNLRDAWPDQLMTILRRDDSPIVGLTTYSDFITAKLCSRNPGVRIALHQPPGTRLSQWTVRSKRGGQQAAYHTAV